MNSLDWKPVLIALFCGACVMPEDAQAPEEEETACGIVACTAADLSDFDIRFDEPSSAGKEDAEAVEGAVSRVTQDLSLIHI